ncbi:MAG: C25 family peptidase [Bacteroidetes bacterium HLUCCA01]|nr:MAG: C25 family peptidase [Bacteroidetes bacterium HLUCCA01]
MIFRRSVLLVVTVLMCSYGVRAQTLEILTQTDSFTDYVLENDSLRAVYRFELTIPHDGNRQTWRVLEQEIVRRDRIADDADLNQILEEVPENSPVIHTENPGVYRKQRVASLLVHVTRRDPDSDRHLLITRRAVIRVYHEPIWDETETRLSRQMQLDTPGPLSTGTWYKIPISRDGIYILDRAYLQNLGIDVNNTDPRNIQVWRAPGTELPRLNATPRPEFTEVPILVTGEADGQLNASDAVIFYGSSQHDVRFDTANNRFEHSIHPYSNLNYVFITVGDTRGSRLQEIPVSQPANRTLRTFTDFIWKEEDLRRPDTRTKSGQQWFGQQFNADAVNRTQSILLDTLSGHVSGTPVQISVDVIARGTRNSQFSFQLGGLNVGSAQIPGISSSTLNSSSGIAANRSQINQTLDNVTLDDDILNLQATFTSLSNDGIGWIDWIRVTATRELRARNGVLHYWSPTDGQPGEIADFRLSGFASVPFVMDVTNPLQPMLLEVVTEGNDYRVRHNAEAGRRFVAHTRLLRPESGNAVPAQNLRGITGFPDYIIVTSDDLLEQALEFADYRRSSGGWEPVVVTQNQIFNEFSGGVPDVTAIRDYVRFLYLRAGMDDERIPRHLLLFGNTTFDFRGINRSSRMINHVFTFQSEESLRRTSTYGSDDLFVLLDSNEGVWAPTVSSFSTFERIDMGVGRLPVQTSAEARNLIEKIRRYESPETYGDWRTIFTFSSDNNENGPNTNENDLHVWNADGTAERINRDNSGVRINKVYQISYPSVNTPLGRLAPEATQAFINSINNGTLIMNFSGHGSEQQLTAERLFTSDDIERLNNADRPTIFVTATCDFGRFDDPDDYSGAEKLINWTNGGAIAAFTTTRVVFTSTSQTSFNFGLNIQLTLQMVERDNNGLPQTLGDIYLNTKNTTVGASFNSRKFVLLGDPAMRIGLPRSQAQITQINTQNTDSGNRVTLRALDQARINGVITNPDGSINTGFNGEAAIQVYDADRFISIAQRVNCNSLPGCQYRVQNDVIFSGRVSVTNGAFTGRFIVPNDIAYDDTTGRILLYGSTPDGGDAVASFSNIVFNGRNPDAQNDGTGPDIQLFLNDETFADGDLVNDTPRLLVNLEDQSGINTAGAGVGHELVGYLSRADGSGSEETFILNNFYRSELDDFTRGTVEYPLDRLQDGQYTLRIRAWDVFNNMNEEEVTFEVARAQDLELRHVYNYPNPMSSYTRFVFEHNQSGRELDLLIRVYTLSGKPVARLQRDNYIPAGNNIQLSWDGRDDDGNLLAAGTYLYHVQVRSDFNGQSRTREKIERLVIIR